MSLWQVSVPLAPGEERRCHLNCALPKAPGGAAPDGVEEGFAKELQGLVELCPALLHRWAALRLCMDETRLARAAEAWPPPVLPAPPPAAFALRGLTEIRICSCPALRRLPPEIVLCGSLQNLVLLSNSLEALPEEIGRLGRLEQLFLNGNFLRELPRSVGGLLALQELCLDANNK